MKIFIDMDLDLVNISEVSFGGGGGGGVKAKITKSIISQQISFEKLYLRDEKQERGKSIHFLKALFKTYSKIQKLMFGGCCCQVKKNIRYQ